MKFPLFCFLLVQPFIIRGFENDRNSTPMNDNKLIQPNKILHYIAIYEDCGGVIPLSPVLDSRIDYKVGQLYDVDEFCVWTLASGVQVTNVRVVATQNMADSRDGITVYFLNSTGLTTSKLPGTKTEFNFNAPLAFLVFSTESTAGTQSNGFSILIESTGKFSTSSVATFHLRKDEGEFSYPTKDPKKNRDKSMALVLQRKTTGYVPTHMEINLENTDIDENDFIEIYIFNQHWKDEPLALIGRFTTDATFQVPSFYPLLILLESKNTLKGKGFQVGWKTFPNSIE